MIDVADDDGVEVDLEDPIAQCLLGIGREGEKANEAGLGDVGLLVGEREVEGPDVLVVVEQVRLVGEDHELVGDGEVPGNHALQ